MDNHNHNQIQVLRFKDFSKLRIKFGSWLCLCATPQFNLSDYPEEDLVSPNLERMERGILICSISVV